MSSTKNTATPAFTFRLFSKSAKNFMSPPENGKGKPCFPAFAKRLSDLIKAKKDKTKANEIEQVIQKIAELVETKLIVLDEIRQELDGKLKMNQTQVNYGSIEITPPKTYPANFSAEVSKRGLQALLAYDHISVLLHQLNSTGFITSNERSEYQLKARRQLNSLFDQAFKWANATLPRTRKANKEALNA